MAKDLETLNGHAVRLYRDGASGRWIFWCKTDDLVQQFDGPADGVRAMISHTHLAGVSVGPGTVGL